MRTTLDIDDDVLQTVKDIAANRRTTAGRVLSELARESLRATSFAGVRNGVPLMPKGNTVITMEAVNRLRDED
ncbi:MAG: hypothetical protein QOC81_242 [Thermoanaerobaculia bacterium]|nr:hypothetical protein [Thermoanaerobaculia bacterium]